MPGGSTSMVRNHRASDGEERRRRLEEAAASAPASGDAGQQEGDRAAGAHDRRRLRSCSASEKPNNAALQPDCRPPVAEDQAARPMKPRPSVWFSR